MMDHLVSLVTKIRKRGRLSVAVRTGGECVPIATNKTMDIYDEEIAS